MRTLLAAATLLQAIVATAEEPLTFKGFAIGAPREAVTAGYPKTAVPCKDDFCVWFPAQDCSSAYYRHEGVNPDECRRVFTYGGLLPHAVGLTFRDEKMVSVRVNFATSAFDELATAMIAKFGRPDDDSTRNARTLTWSRDEAIMRLVKQGPKPDQGFMSLISVRYLRDAAAEREQKAKERAKDL